MTPGDDNPEVPKLPWWIERGKEVRWRAQSPDQMRYSSSWRAWTRPKRKDVYLAHRGLAGEVKVSLHESGQYQVGFISPERSVAWQGLGRSRHLDKWERPPEFAPGWTRLYEVILPGDELRAHSEPGLAGKAMINLTVVPAWAVHVYLLHAEMRPERVDLRFSDAFIMAIMDLGDDDRVAVVAVLREWDVGAALVEAARRRALAGDPRHLAPPGRVIDPLQPSTRLLFHGVHTDCARFVVDTAGMPLA